MLGFAATRRSGWKVAALFAVLLVNEQAHGQPAAPAAPPLPPPTITVTTDAVPEPPPAPPEPKPEVVSGADRKLNASWDVGGIRLKSADGVFNVHIGGRLMTDEVWWNQSPGLQQSNVPPLGSPLLQETGVGPGIGSLTDGYFVRRARFVADGTIFKTNDFKVEFDFENYNSIAFDECFVGARDVPYLGMVRLGQVHVPFGLEAYTSSRFLPMLERSPLYDAFYQEFAPGVFINRTFFGDRITTQHLFHRIDNFNQFNGDSFGDGTYAYSGRISGLPWYEDEGRNLLHLGISYQWRKGSPPLDFNGGTMLSTVPNSNVTTNTELIRFRARQSIRDAVGQQGDNNRVIDTGNIIANHVQGVNAEVLCYRGPLWFQSESTVAYVNGTVYPAGGTGTRRATPNFWGSYLQAGFFFTGESRGYDKPMGKFGRVVPKKNFYLARDDTGRVQHGPGAWEFVYRYSYANLNGSGIQGGIYSEHTVGLNWYWNSNIKIQFNYINGQRTVPVGAVSGNVQGFGLRGALEF